MLFVKVLTRTLVAIASTIAVMPTGALAERLSSSASLRIMETGEVLVSQAIRWEAADFGGNRQMAAAFNNRPQFNFVVRTSVAVEDSDGTSIPAGLFYCRVGQSLDEHTTTAVCTDTY